MRLGALIFAGAAFLAIEAVVLQWRLAPAFLRIPLMEFVFVLVGILFLVAALTSYALDRREAAPRAPALHPEAAPSPESSLMALPALVSEAPGPSVLSPAPEPPQVPRPVDAPPAGAPASLAAASTESSTLLIPFAGASGSPAHVPVAPGPGETVSRLVDRMDALQRVAPGGTSPSTASTAAPVEGPITSSLRLRLTRVPVPPAGPSAAFDARRCTDCGEPFESPPQYESCADCGRALCERCYWRTSSGPQAHLCTSCFRNRSVPRPPAPAVTFAKPAPTASAPAPSGRWFRLRRPGN